MKYFKYLLIALIFFSCGPAYHLKRAEHHIDKAISKGASIKKDTIQFNFKSPEIKFSTTLKPTWEKHIIRKDTLRYIDPKTASIIKTVIDQNTNCPDSCNQIKMIYLESEVPPQDQTVDVPCETVKAGFTIWEVIILSVFVAVIAYFVGRFRK